MKPGTRPARAVPRREGWFARLNTHFHTHPKGRQHEFLFWFVLGAALGAFALIGWRVGWLNTAIALVLAVVAVCLILWAFLPQQRKPSAPTPHPKSKRRS